MLKPTNLAPQTPVRLTLVLLALLLSTTVTAQTTTFTYQGKLADTGTPSNGSYDFDFKLFDELTGGTGVGSALVNGVSVTNGIFTVNLDFGVCPACFSGANRFLEISVRPSGSGPFTTLSPRQQVTSAPYAIKSQNATSADGLSVACVNCVTSSQIASVSGSAVTGTIPVASLPAGSENYIQNTASVQAASNFNISGNGTAGGTLSGNAVNAETQYNLGGARVMSNQGSANLFAGVSAGAANTTGFSNAFFGSGSGDSNTSGFSNSFFGTGAGQSNIVGNRNSFFGHLAGSNNTASGNSFFGTQAGRANTLGSGNSFFGDAAGDANTIGSSNSFFGDLAGNNNTASFNSFFGFSTGFLNTTGSSNSFFGTGAGFANTIGSFNSFFGEGAGNNNTASGNSFFGSSAGVANTTGTQNSFFGYRAGEANTASTNSFFGSAAGQNNTTGAGNSFFGNLAGTSNTIGGSNSFFGDRAGSSNTTGVNNSFFGFNTAINNTSGLGNSFFGSQAGFSNTTGGGNAFFGNSAGSGTTSGSANSFFGVSAGFNNITGKRNVMLGDHSNFRSTQASSTGAVASDENIFIGYQAGGAAARRNAAAIGTNAFVACDDCMVLGTTGVKVGIGMTSPEQNLSVNGGLVIDQANLNDGTLPPGTNTALTFGSGSGEGIVSKRTAGGNQFGMDFYTNFINRMSITNGGNVGIGQTNPLARLWVEGDTFISGKLTVSTLSAATAIHLCTNAIFELSLCSSSIRYKTNVLPLNSGLELLSRLRPVTFDWITTRERDLGLIAEEVEKVEPLLVTRDKTGQIQGVKYDQLNVLLINAINEQQSQIKGQQSRIEIQHAQIDKQLGQIEKQQRQIESLLKLVCLDHPGADICEKH